MSSPSKLTPHVRKVKSPGVSSSDIFAQVKKEMDAEIDHDFIFAEVQAEMSQESEIDPFVELHSGKFQKTLDADTLDISRNRLSQRVRLAGIDAPESGQQWGPAAHKYLDKLIGDERDIRANRISQDVYGRDVSILSAGGKDLSYELVKAGHAKKYEGFLDTLPEHFKFKLENAQLMAERDKAGIWGSEVPYEEPSDWRKRIGPEASTMGHDNRPPIDDDLIDDRAIFAQVQYEMDDPEARAAKADEAKYARLNRIVDKTSDKFYEDQGIKRNERYTKEDGFFEHALGALDYTGNVARSGIKGFAEGDGWDRFSSALKYGRQAADKKRYTSSSDLKDSVTGEIGLGKVRFGKDDNHWTPGDTWDFITNLALDIGTDPITYLTMGTGSIVKGGGKLAKMLPALHKGAVEAKLGLQTADVAKYLKYQTTVRAGLGAVYGMGAVDGEDDLGLKLLAAGLGAVTGAKGGKALSYPTKWFTKGFDGATDWYAAFSRDDTRFKNFSVAKRFLLRGYNKTNNIAEWIKQGRYEALDAVKDPVDKLKVHKIMEDLKTEFIKRRNHYEEHSIFLDKKDPAYKAVMQKQDIVITQNIEKKFLPRLLENESKAVADSVVAWGKHNQKVIEKLNRDIYGLKKGYVFDANGKRIPGDEVGRGIVGIKWHIDDVYNKLDLKEIENSLESFALHKAKSLSRSDHPMLIAMDQYKKQTGKTLTKEAAEELAVTDSVFAQALLDARNKTYAVYAEGFSKKFLDLQEKKAMDFMAKYHGVKPKVIAESLASDVPLAERLMAERLVEQEKHLRSLGVKPMEAATLRRGIKTFENGLAGYDKLTNFMKRNMLFASLSWVKNNYFDNMGKAFLETGVGGMVDAASMGKFRDGVFKDVQDLYQNKMFRKYTNSDLQDALARGVLDNPMFKSFEDEATRKLLYTPAEVLEQGNKTENLLEKGIRIWLDNPMMKATAGIGSHMEGTARMVTYIRTKEMLMASPVVKKMGKEGERLAKDAAAKLVSKTFFDYGDISHFENAVFKRMIPFYSFYSKNMPYWIKAAYDPEKVARVIALEKTRRNVGKDPNEFQKKGLSKYLQDNGARYLGKTKKGDSEYGIVPSGSMYDAVRQISPGNFISEAVNKGHPLWKAIYEVSTGDDLFDGSQLLPSNAKDKKKFLFSRGHKYRPLGAVGLPGAYVDKKGNPYTNSDALVLFDKALSTLWPVGVVDQLAGAAGKTLSGKETPNEAVLNLVAPMKTVKVSDAYGRMIREQKRKERLREKFK